MDYESILNMTNEEAIRIIENTFMTVRTGRANGKSMKETALIVAITKAIAALKNENNPLAHPESYLDTAEAIVDDMTMAQRKALLAHLEGSIAANS